jgi:hypothetical protein
MHFDRATTTLDAGTISLANRWLARSWTAFSGATMELQQQGFEWTSRRSPEFLLETNRGIIGVHQTPEVEWSEEVNPFGAAVTARRMGDGVDVVLRTFLFHEVPCMLRRCTVYNTGTTPMRLSRCAPEALAIQSEGACVRTHEFLEERERVQWETDEEAVAILGSGRGLVLGMAGGAAYELFAPEPDRCAAYTRGAVEVPPGRHWTAPEVRLASFEGELENFLGRTWGEVRLALRQLHAWELEMRPRGSPA